MSLSVGQPAPLFNSFESNKDPFSLEALRGENVLLLFFPAAFTSTCTKELCSMRDDIATYNNLDCKIVGISIDTVYALAKYKGEQHLNFPLVSDFNKEIGALYDVQYPLFNNWMLGVTKRSAFLVDKHGILQYVEVLEKGGDLPDFEKIKAALQKLK